MQTAASPVRTAPDAGRACPDCGTETVNVQGIRACADCDWNAT